MAFLDEPQQIPGPEETDRYRQKYVSPMVDEGSNKKVLRDFYTDRSKSVTDLKSQGAGSITVREDLIPYLLEAKRHLNDYDIPFTFNYIPITLYNNEISHFARAGIEINLNINSGMSRFSNYINDDYFIGPNYNMPIGNNYHLNVYGYVRRRLSYLEPVVVPFERETDVYDVSVTYLSGAPKIRKIFKPLVNITEMMLALGFVQYFPDNSFFKDSDYEKANWNKFYFVEGLYIGYKYVDLLNMIYDNVDKTEWPRKNLTWDGNKFTWQQTN